MSSLVKVSLLNRIKLPGGLIESARCYTEGMDTVVTDYRSGASYLQPTSTATTATGFDLIRCAV